MKNRISLFQGAKPLFLAAFLSGLLAGCGTTPPPLPSGERVPINHYAGQWTPADDLTAKHETPQEKAKRIKVLVSKLKVLAMKERAFSTEVSHEVRTPLTVIDTSLELLNEQVQGNDRQKTLIRRAQNASSRIKGMAEVFLNIGRARTGQNNALCSMPELIAGLKESWKQKAENKGLKLSIEMKNMPKQTFNEVLGATIFDNLVFNAIHYTDKGSVTVIVDEDQAIIRDTGIGIKEEDREKVFDRGFRAGQGGRGHYQGFGLGLAISKRAAEALGWSISLKSEVGKGTDFVIRFKPESVDEVNSNQ